MPTDKEAQQAEVFIQLQSSIMKLAGWRSFFTQLQCIAVAETLRDCADNLDLGAGERGKRYCIPVRKRMINAGRDAQGRQLFRLTS